MAKILVSRGFAFCKCPGAWYFEGLSALNLVNSRGFVFCRCPGALYFEGLGGLNLVDSRGFAFCTRPGAWPIHALCSNLRYANVHIYIYTQNSPVALYTHLFRFKVSFESRCSFTGKARVEWNVYIVRRANSEYICIYVYMYICTLA